MKTRMMKHNLYKYQMLDEITTDGLMWQIQIYPLTSQMFNYQWSRIKLIADLGGEFPLQDLAV